MKINDFNSELELMKESDVRSEERVTTVTKKPMPEKTEVLEKRGSHSKTFQKKKGKFETIYYNTPIHKYNDDEKMFVEMCDGVEESEKSFDAKKNGFDIRFYKHGNSHELFMMKRGNYQLCVSAKNQFGNQSKRPIPVLDQDHNHIRYVGASADTDYNCSVTSSGVKVAIVKNSANSADRQTFLIVSDGMRHIWNDADKVLRFISEETDETVFEIPAPFMIDTSGTVSESASFEIVSVTESICELSVVPDIGWLSDKNRAYPVLLEWSTICSNPVPNGFVFDHQNISADGKVAIGGQPVNFKMCLPEKQSGMITKRVKALFHCDAVPTAEDKEYLLVLNRVTASDAEEEPTIERIGVSTMSIGKTEYAFDVTSEYTADENTAYSLQLCEEQDGELVATEYASVALMTLSADSAISTFSVEETDGTSEEDSSSGESGNIGSVGTYEVDLVSGKLNLEMKDFAWEGNRMPVSVSRSYKGQFASQNYGSWSNANGNFGNMLLGYGWRMNLMQSMVNTGSQKVGDAYKNTYTYTDESGEETIFAQCECESGSATCTTYEDVDGLGYVYESATGVLTKGTEKHTFSSGRLVKIVDEFGNTMTINYSSGRISSVKDGVGRTFTFGYSGNYLVSIAAPNGSSIQYQYCNGNLCSATYPNGQTLTFAYDTTDNQPSAVTVSGSGITALTTYFTISDDQVIEVGTSVNDVKSGKYTTFYYTNSKQTIVSECDLVEYGKTNDDDVIKHSVYLHETPQYNYSYYEAQNENKIDLSDGNSIIIPYTDPGKDIGNIKCANLLKNHNFNRSGTSISLTNWTNDLTGDYRDVQYDPAEKMPGQCAAYLINLYSEEKEKGIHQSVSLTSGKSYVFSCYLKLAQGNSNPSRGVYLWVKNSSGTVSKKSEMITTRGDFARVAVPFTAVASESYTVGIYIDGNIKAKAIAPQLEEGTMLSPYNYLSMPNINNVNYVIGDATIEKETSWGTVKVASGKGVRETFTLSGYIGGGIVYSSDKETLVGLRATINYSSSDVEPDKFIVPVHCEAGEENRQFTMVQFCKRKYAAVDNIEISCVNHFNTKIVGFHELQLVRNSYEDGLTEEDFIDNESTNDEVDDEVGSDYVVDDFEEIVFNEVMDSFGNALTGTNFKNGELGAIYTEQKFEDSNPSDTLGDAGNNKTSEIDARGNETKYEYDAKTSKPTKVTDRCGNSTSYAYDAAGRATKVTAPNGGTVSYGYNSYDDLTSITRGDGQKYTMGYDAYRNLTSVKVEGMTKNLVTYDYKSGGNRLKSMTYANGAVQTLTYDRFGNVIGEAWNGVMAYRCFYDASNQLVKTLDISNKKMYNINRVGENVTSIEEYDVATINVSDGIYTPSGLTLVGTMHYSFDSDGKQFRKKYVAADGSEQKYVFEYQDEQNVAVQLPTGVVSHAKSDHLGRKIFDELQLGKGLMNRKFTYHEGVITDAHLDNDKQVSDPQTTLVKQIEFADGRTIQYEYDAEERISSVIDTYIENGEVVTNKTAYTYDALGQLSQEITNAEFDDEGKVIGGNRYGYQYDPYGNIIKKGACDENGDFTGSGIIYSYDGTWKDKLTSYNGQSIVYDDPNGNPTEYLGVKNIKWEKGRQLKTFGTNSYKYNNEGIRIEKTTSTEVHDYILDGTNIVKEIVTDTANCPKYVNEYLYDLDGTVCGIKHDGTAYYFYKNLQGDVIAITDDTGAVVARYTYDAWGKVLSVTDSNGMDISQTATHIANINPFRYRSYYYDTETKLYYLQSRYYNPEVGRFINADRSENFCSTYSVLSNNAFCYCENNPVNETDDQGNIIATIGKLLGKMLMGAITGFLVQLMTDIILTVTAGKARFSTWGTYAECACSGALDALINKGLVGNIMVTVVSNMLGQFIDLIRGKTKKFDVWRLIYSIVDSILLYILEKKLRIKEPEYIRDIKQEARGLGVKGKNNLEAYLKAKIKLLKNYNYRVVNLMKLAYNIVKEFVLGFFGIVKEWITAIAEYIRNVINMRRVRQQYA